MAGIDATLTFDLEFTLVPSSTYRSDILYVVIYTLITGMDVDTRKLSVLTAAPLPVSSRLDARRARLPHVLLSVGSHP
jgi:hypothetical protein